MNNLYQILQIKASATPDEIRQKYELLMKQFENKDKTAPMNAELIESIERAYAILSDPTKRVSHDKMLQTWIAKEKVLAQQQATQQMKVTPRFIKFIRTLFTEIIHGQKRWKVIALSLVTLAAVILISVMAIQLMGKATENPCKPELDRARSSEERLLVAAKCGDLKMVRSLVDHGTDVNTRETKPPYLGRTPLHYASEVGNFEVVQYLLSRGSNLNAQTNIGSTPLHVASENNQRAIAELLLRRGADVNALDKRGAPLHLAINRGAFDVVETLINYGADVNASKLFSEETPLHELATVTVFQPSHEKIMALLKQKGADFNALDGLGRTPLDIAQPPAAGLLIKNGALPAVKADDPQDLIHRAAKAGSKEAVEYLLSQGYAIGATEKDGTTLLHHAAASGNIELLDFLLFKGIDVNARKGNGRTPLHEAAFAGKEAAVAFLIKKGAQPNVVDNKGFSPLHAVFSDNFYLFWDSNKNIVRALIEAGANSNIQDDKGYTLLHRAADQESLRQLLKDRGLSVEARARGADGKTPLHSLMVYGKNPDSVKALIRMGAGVNIQDNNGNTPLHLISQLGLNNDRMSLGRTLIAEGADVSIRNNEGLTPFGVLKRNPAWIEKYPHYAKLLETGKK